MKKVAEGPFGVTENHLNPTATMLTGVKLIQRTVFRGTNNAAPGTLIRIWNTMDCVDEKMMVEE